MSKIETKRLKTSRTTSSIYYHESQEFTWRLWKLNVMRLIKKGRPEHFFHCRRLVITSELDSIKKFVKLKFIMGCYDEEKSSNFA